LYSAVLRLTARTRGRCCPSVRVTRRRMTMRVSAGEFLIETIGKRSLFS